MGLLPVLKSNFTLIMVLICTCYTLQTAFCDIIINESNVTVALGGNAIFNCSIEVLKNQRMPYGFTWSKAIKPDTSELANVYFWHESYKPRYGEGYHNRVSSVPLDSFYGKASLNLTNVTESDKGWYLCTVAFSDNYRSWNKTETWFYLDVSSPPRFKVTPEDITYVNWNDNITLTCHAEGAPAPKVLWYKDDNTIKLSKTTEVSNDGMDLRLSNIQPESIGVYTCISQNTKGQISHNTTLVAIAGAEIRITPVNQTKLEGEKVVFHCETKGIPYLVPVEWFRGTTPLKDIAQESSRITIGRDGSLVINPILSNDTDKYTCNINKSSGKLPAAEAYLDVEYPAKVDHARMPVTQYLPLGSTGIVDCHIKAKPPLQYVTWTKNKRLIEPYRSGDIIMLNNGSLMFATVNLFNEGRYTCTPYNAHGTQGSSEPIQVVVRRPPFFTIKPEALYQRNIGETVEMHCEAQEAEGTQEPTIQWKRIDGTPLQGDRIHMSGGNITIQGLRRSDFDFYKCIAVNEVATILSLTQLVVDGPTPYAPYSVTANVSEFAVTLNWIPGYNGVPAFKQNYVIRYRENGTNEWSTTPVTPLGSITATISYLNPGTTYEFQVLTRNALGEELLSEIKTIRTLEADKTVLDKVQANRTAELKPGPPRNVTVSRSDNGFLISWQPPLERAHLIQYYTIRYRTDGPYKILNKGPIRPEENSYLVKNMVSGRTYDFRVLAYSATSFESSEEVTFTPPGRHSKAAFRNDTVVKQCECECSFSNQFHPSTYLLFFTILSIILPRFSTIFVHVH